ncbi:ADP-ribosylglycohydrolase family protein [Bradyrhizobium sp. Cham227]|nr:ADP-ribosylglycohydrolase family protein [Bradyrhizobium brasilense]
MRVAAVGWLASTESEVLDLAAAQAAVSHDHPDAIAAARAVDLSIFLLRKNVAPQAFANGLLATSTMTSALNGRLAAAAVLISRLQARCRVLSS